MYMCICICVYIYIYIYINIKHEDSRTITNETNMRILQDSVNLKSEHMRSYAQSPNPCLDKSSIPQNRNVVKDTGRQSLAKHQKNTSTPIP